MTTLETLTVAFFLALVTERIVAAVTAPLRLRFPDWPGWWSMIYVAWIVGGLLSWLAGINLFAELVPTLDPVTGRLLTAVVCGGGGNLIHDILDQRPTIRVTAETSLSDPASVTASVGADGVATASITPTETTQTVTTSLRDRVG